MHRATLKTGEQVVVKVQRKGIHEVMSKDMALLHKAVKLVPPISIKGIVDFDMVLDEMWAVAQEEMNFLLEASNIEEFAGNNRDVAFVATPKLYRKYTTSHVLVMEYIKGFNIDDKEGLLKDGYDLEEIGSKLIDNYIRQVIEDGFFHADPHPGNVQSTPPFRFYHLTAEMNSACAKVLLRKTLGTPDSRRCEPLTCVLHFSKKNCGVD